MAQILVVEPDTILRKQYLRALTEAGHRVDLASDAQGAVHAINENRPDLIVVELQLQRHNGIEFLYELRSYADWLEIPVVVFSVVPQQESGLRGVMAQKLGIVDYLYKPTTNLDKLLKSVNRQVMV